jgi:phosphatidylglycerol:prolipoprotein diacylglycerol transferase
VRERLIGALGDIGWPSWLIPDYWFMFTLGITVACLVALYLWSQTERRDRLAADLLFWGILAIIPGAKLVYALQFGMPLTVQGFYRSGMAMYGGLLGVLATWLFIYWLKPYPWRLFLDAVTPGLAIGLSLGRIGCFMAGCNGGVPSGLPWAVRFPPSTSAFVYQLNHRLIDSEDVLSLPAHPTQLYESLFALTAFILLLGLFRSEQGTGKVFFTGMLWYAVFRFASEPLRGDHGDAGCLFGWFSFAQVISLLVLGGALVGLYYSRTKAGRFVDR